jgi:hypothetical protein
MNLRPKPKRLKRVRDLVLGLVDGHLRMPVGKPVGSFRLVAVLS